MMGRMSSLPFVGKVAFDLNAYVTTKALDGMFLMIGREEEKIRRDPVARTTDIHKTVFGGPGESGKKRTPWWKKAVSGGSSDRVIPTVNSFTLSEHLPNAQLIVYPDSGHGALIQHAGAFTSQRPRSKMFAPLRCACFGSPSRYAAHGLESCRRRQKSPSPH